MELQLSLEELRKLQATKDREEHKSVQEPSAAQELQLAKMAHDLRKELEMDQLRESIRKTTRVSKDPAQHGSCGRPKSLMGQVGKN